MRTRLLIATLLGIVLLGAACQTTEETTTDAETEETPNGEAADPMTFEQVVADYMIPLPDGAEPGNFGETEGALQVTFLDAQSNPDAYESLVEDAGWVVDDSQPINSIKYKVHHMGNEVYRYAWYVYFQDGNVNWLLYEDMAARDAAYEDR